MKNNKEIFMGVETIHTFMMSEDDDKNLFLGMEVYNSKKDKHQEIVLVIRPEDYDELFQYLLEKKIEEGLELIK